jgi:quinohemoprotein ethanol dehydrogenase
MAFDPQTGLLYIPAMQAGDDIATGNLHPEIPTLAGVKMSYVRGDDTDAQGTLLAWDPVRQTARWKVRRDAMWNGGTLATAGNLVFQGTADGYFEAYDAASGNKLWSFNAGLGIVGAPSTYAIDGKQYVSILVGWGGTVSAGSSVMNIGWKFGENPRRVLTFALDGKATLPPSAPRSMVVNAVDDPKLALSNSDSDAGHKLFNVYCFACHGMDAVSAGAPGPDLRESNTALHEDSLWSIVHEGALLPLGMPRFDSLNQQQVHEIFSYVRGRARDVIKQQNKSQPQLKGEAPVSN